jgi:hypothetical protein
MDVRRCEVNDWQTPGCNRYGAAMGRNPWAPSGAVGAPVDERFLPADTADHLYLRRVRLDSSGYDQGGAYWGHGTPLYCAWDSQGRVRYLRAASRAKAKAQFPAARFYR